VERTGCLIAGGGPAGIMLGLLLARAGVNVIVCEKHGDFLRDFRGDTVHASTLWLLDELGLADRFGAMPHSKLYDFQLPVGDHTILLADFRHLPQPYDHIAMAPQWDLLSLLTGAANAEPGFALRMNTEVLGPVFDSGRVVGARVRDADGTEFQIAADLTVACDGRDSAVRAGAGLRPRQYRVPYEVWWFRLSRSQGDEQQQPTLLPKVSGTDILLSMTREGYDQLAYLAPTGSADRLRAEGIEQFRKRIARLRPDLAGQLDELTSLDNLPQLHVQLSRLPRWHRAGLLCIGDAAHAMSPSGGVGVNLAFQDATAAAALLAGPLLAGRVTSDDLARVRRRRLFPTVFLQTGQRVLHDTIYVPRMAGLPGGFELVTLALRLLPVLARPLGRLVAIGPQPEPAPDFARRPSTP
jgi:2-polyprenyl-6-methoxyphenol hydroxylase-like FAD-dependent oxidoreductase